MSSSHHLRRTVPLVMIAPLVVGVGVTGLLAFLNGRSTVNDLAQRLVDNIAQRVENEVVATITLPHQLNQWNADQLRLGLLNPEDLSTFEKPLYSQLQQTPYFAYVYWGNEQREFVGAGRVRNNQVVLARSNAETDYYYYNYEVDAQGNRGARQSIEPEPYDPRQRPWYQDAVAAKQATWGSIYIWAGGYEDIALPAVYPVFNPTGQLQGVFGIDISLGNLSEFLRGLGVGKTGHTFIIERDGLLVASSSQEGSYDAQLRRVEAINSQEPLIQNTAQMLLNNMGSFTSLDDYQKFSFRWQGKQHLVRVQPIRDAYGLDWLIVVVLPKADFMQQVNLQTRLSIILGLASLCLAIILGLILGYWVIRPIVRLNEAATELRTQQFEPSTIEDLTRRSDEIGEFARVFQNMAITLDTQEQSLEEQLQEMQLQLGDKYRKLIRGQGQNLTELKQIQKKAKLIREVKKIEINLVEALKKVTYFSSLKETEIQQIIEAGYQKVFDTGEYICREDEPGDEFYIIVSGTVEIFVEKINKYLTQLKPGAFFGELSLLIGIPRTATVITREETRLFILNREALGTLLKQYQSLADEITHQLNLHQAELQERQELLRKYGLLDDDFNNNPMRWVQNRMKTLFGV
ncbi:cyclic nucleotide-binding domain-containing protein [Spirulina subsalsa FACHB-351]|uniref:Cyclic nucleotide-binding domain-containing protein n=1 Tax=Spirulina subsalsa FACHB-351 TaxID=234711 RepID=A0ABT3L9R4_9CYAN|nr:cache domain-containing protein [Spirulina subsalsa]MCW6037854.1 cyclic nucleotide-binding domain-containing protein [Spirulina subsalsa FACHB-351]